MINREFHLIHSSVNPNRINVPKDTENINTRKI